MDGADFVQECGVVEVGRAPGKDDDPPPGEGALHNVGLSTKPLSASWRDLFHPSASSSPRATPIKAKWSGSVPEQARLQRARTTSRLARSPVPANSTMAQGSAGGALWLGCPVMPSDFTAPLIERSSGTELFRSFPGGFRVGGALALQMAAEPEAHSRQ